MPAKVKANAKPFPVVAIGASAGGLEAFTELLQQLPPNTGMALVYIQHMSATQESALPDILKKVTKMKVVEAGHQLPLQKNHVYVIPPGKDITIEGGKIIQQERKTHHGMHMPVDEFFISLAEDKKSAAIGVVLSGNASDGTLGLKAINAAGGLTFAQDESAKFMGMPRSAIAEGIVDKVLSPRDIARELEQMSKNSHIIKVAMQDTEDSISNDDEDLTAVIQLLKKSIGVDFRHYKMNTIKRRIVRRMLLYKLESLKEYTQYLKQHANEINVLYEDLLINVTSFFRDP
jgi:two-component system CheB/CheR fusion protein